MASTAPAAKNSDMVAILRAMAAVRSAVSMRMIIKRRVILCARLGGWQKREFIGIVRIARFGIRITSELDPFFLEAFQVVK